MKSTAPARVALIGVGRRDADHRRSRFDLHVRGGFDGSDGAGERCGDGGFHLHALQHGERVALGDPITGFDENRQHERRPGAAHDAAVVAEHGVRGAVDVDAQRWLLPRPTTTRCTRSPTTTRRSYPSR